LGCAGGTCNKSGYTFTILNNTANVFAGTAVPQTANTTGVRSFYITEDGVVRVQAAGGVIADCDACLALAATQP